MTQASTGKAGTTAAEGTGGAGPTTQGSAASTGTEGGVPASTTVAGVSTLQSGTEGSTQQDGAGVTTSQAGAGATSTLGQGAATTTADPASRGKAAQAAKEEATKEKEEAEATVAAAQETATKAAEVGDKIDKVVAAASGATTPSAGRVRRQETTGIPTFTVPSTCASFQAMVKEMNAQIALKTVTGFATASNIGTALIDVNPDTISCSASDVAALNAVKAEVTAAVEETNKVIVVKQNAIKEAVEKINEAIAEITAANEDLVNSGQTAFADPGTPLATVTAPPLPTEITTSQEGTTGGAPAGETTPGAGTEAGTAGPTTAGGAEGATTAGGAEGATTAGGAEATTAGAAETSPPMLSTANPSRRKFFGKRSRGTIF